MRDSHTSTRSFRDLIEALNNKKRAKYSSDEDDEESDFFSKQKNKGEQEFRDAHGKPKISDIEPEPVEEPKQSKKQGASLGASGENVRPTQGTSKLSPNGKKTIGAFQAQTPLRRGDADNVGDIKPVVLSPSAVNPKNGNAGINYQPANLDANNKQDGDRAIVRTSKSAVTPAPAGKRKAFSQFQEELKHEVAITTPFDALFSGIYETVTFASGESCILDEEAAILLRSVFDMLEDTNDNKEAFRSAICESIESLVAVIQYIQSHIEEGE